MKSFRKELWFDIPARVGFVNITPQVQACLRESGIAEGLVLVNLMHITASVFINDDESGLHEDYEKWLEKLAPHEPTSAMPWHVGMLSCVTAMMVASRSTTQRRKERCEPSHWVARIKQELRRRMNDPVEQTGQVALTGEMGYANDVRLTGMLPDGLDG